MRRISFMLTCFFLASSTLADSVLSWESICTGSNLRWRKVDFSIAGLIPRKDGQIRIDVWTGQSVRRPGTIDWEFEAQAPGCPNLATRGVLEIPKGGFGATEILLAFPAGCRADMTFTLDIEATGKKIFKRDPINPVVGARMLWTPLAPECGNGILEPPERCDGGVTPCTTLGYEDDPDDPFFRQNAICLPSCDGWDTFLCWVPSAREAD